MIYLRHRVQLHDLIDPRTVRNKSQILRFVDDHVFHIEFTPTGAARLWGGRVTHTCKNILDYTVKDVQTLSNKEDKYYKLIKLKYCCNEWHI